jgi:hypothetical protein
VQRVASGRALLIAAVCGLIPLAVNVVAAFVTDWTGVAPWLVAPLVAVVVAVLNELAQAYREAPPKPRPDEPHPPRPRGTRLPVAILVAILVLGVGGVFLTLGVRYAVGYLTGNETGTERLVERTRASSAGLTLIVRSVQDTAHFTRVGVTARNESGVTLTLPLFGYCSFIGGNGTTLDANAFKSDWTESIANGGVQRGTITFDGHLGPRVRRATLTFTTIFRQGFTGPESISVPDIPLRRGE